MEGAGSLSAGEGRTGPEPWCPGVATSCPAGGRPRRVGAAAEERTHPYVGAGAGIGQVEGVR